MAVVVQAVKAVVLGTEITTQEVSLLLVAVFNMVWVVGQILVVEVVTMLEDPVLLSFNIQVHLKQTAEN
jgi:hypothetical protein